MRQVDRAGQNWRSVGCLVTWILAGLSLCGCGGGSGSSQSLQSGVVAQQSPAVTSTIPANQSSTSVAGCSVNSFVPNFATETDPATGLPNQLYHWTAFPAHVYFAPSAFLTPIRKAQTLAGFGWWVQATGAAVTYQEVGSAFGANIVVQYDTRGDTHYGAITEYHTDGKRQMLDATITFNMTYLDSVANITPVAAHEFGHALGIGGHSGDSNDVMSSSPQVYNLTLLSVRDLNTLKTAYCGLPDAISSPGSSTSGIARGTGQISVVRCGLGAN